MASTGTTRRIASVKPSAVQKPLKERVLIEFPASALRRTDKAARAEGVSRSEFIRTAIEQRLDAIDGAEFEHVDREAWEALP